MPLISLVITLVIIGVLLLLVNTYIPMQPPIKQILNAVVIIVLVIWILNLFLPLGSLGTIRVPPGR